MTALPKTAREISGNRAIMYFHLNSKRSTLLNAVNEFFQGNAKKNVADRQQSGPNYTDFTPIATYRNIKFYNA